jgi:hypothetical protein
MATFVNVTVGSDDLLTRAKTQQQAARFAKVEQQRLKNLKLEKNKQDQDQSQDGDERAQSIGSISLRRDLAASITTVKADYYVVSYAFATGLDLDTRTYLLDPVADALLGPVGWCKDESISVEERKIVDWGGDNTGTGVESVLFDRLAYEDVYGLGRKALLSLNAFWFNQKGGLVTVEVTGYKGGAMVKTGFTWVNPTAKRKWVKFETYPTDAVQTQTGTCVDGDFISYLEIDYLNGRVRYLPEP